MLLSIDPYHYSTFHQKLEKCIFNELYSFVAPLFHVKYGFRAKRSTVLQLLAYMDTIYRNVEDPDIAVECVYLDFSKAFDKIDHSILLKKLWDIGVRGHLFSLLTSYLSQRKQIFTKNGISSNHAYIRSGVPQCSNLGPLLFLI